jgi:hypothetical protein
MPGWGEVRRAQRLDAERQERAAALAAPHLTLQFQEAACIASSVKVSLTVVEGYHD